VTLKGLVVFQLVFFFKPGEILNFEINRVPFCDQVAVFKEVIWHRNLMICRSIAGHCPSCFTTKSWVEAFKRGKKKR
jgi:hypothetical protein